MRDKGWLIYNKEDVEKNKTFIKRIMKSGEKINIDIDLYIKEDFSYGVFDNKLGLKHSGSVIAPGAFVINRSRDSLLSKQLEYMGVKVYNNSLVQEICNDKAKTHQYLARYGIRMMNTVFCKKSEIPEEITELKYPIIIKNSCGRGGNEVFKATDPTELSEIVDNMEAKDLILQDLCPNPGKDIRVFVVGKEIVAAIIRYSEKDFRANYSLGGSSKLYKLNHKEESIIKQIIARFDFGMVGIDFLLDAKGEFIFNEIEDVVGSRTLSINSDLDITQVYLDYIKTDLRS